MSGLRSLALTASALLSVANAFPYAPGPLAPSPTAALSDVVDSFYAPNNPSLIPLYTKIASLEIDGTRTISTSAGPSSSAMSASDFPSLPVSASDVAAYQKMPIDYAHSSFAPVPTGIGRGNAHGHRHRHHRPHGTAPFPWRPTGYSTVTTYPTAYPTATGSVPKPLPTTLYGVNVGGWLILESWMNSDVFSGTNATDQYSFDQTEGAEEALQKHWSSYITQNDFKQMSEWGINAVRIPIGYWSYNNYGTPYIKGADAYLEKAIGWARQYNIKVLVDCHGSPGSQNGFDNSGRSGYVRWQTDNNLQQSIDILTTMAKKYGSNAYSDVVASIELVNEPISWEQNDFGKTQAWAKQAYTAVRNAAENKNLKIVMHDGFMGPSKWGQVGQSMNGNLTKANAGFVIDVHLYQNQMAADKLLDQSQHIDKACNNWTASELLPKSAQLPVYVGEFTPATDICAYANSDKTTGGTACYEDQCQCSADQDITIWREPLKQATGKFFEAQIDAFEQTAAGWFVWSWKGPGAWGLQNLIQQEIIAQHVTERKYPPQCSFPAGNATAAY